MALPDSLDWKKLLFAWGEWAATPHQRKGQALSNALHQIYPRAGQALTGHKADCYYDDTKIPLFLEALAALAAEEESKG